VFSFDPLVIAAKTYSPVWYKVMSKVTACHPGRGALSLHWHRTGTGDDRDCVQGSPAGDPTLSLESQNGVIRGAQAAIGNGFFTSREADDRGS